MIEMADYWYANDDDKPHHTVSSFLYLHSLIDFNFFFLHFFHSLNCELLFLFQIFLIAIPIDKEEITKRLVTLGDIAQVS